ncbi:MAG: L,D-transpeptidase family protein [Firmicutes bacterium]|nr:L,D-transpeptidase family protein [Bacillota bacterium]
MKRIISITLAVIMMATVFADIPLLRVSAAETNNETNIETDVQQLEGNTGDEVQKINIADAAAAVENSRVQYTGEQVYPGSITVTYGETILTEGTDYTVAYSNNIEPGLADVMITGTGLYEGTKVVKFEIYKPQIKDAEIVLSATDLSYSGKARKPYPKSVTYQGVELVKNIDYKVKGYSNNIYPGTAKVTIEGIGKYAGTVDEKFTIAAINDFKVASRTTESIKLSWKKESNVKGYKVYKYNFSTKKWKLIKTIKSNKTTSYTVKDLVPGRGNKYSVRTYVVKGKTYYGPRAEMAAATKPSKVVLKSFVSGRERNGRVTWGKRNSTGYQVQLARNSKFTNAKKYTVKSDSTVKMTFENLTNDKTYYVRVRAYKTYYGVTTYGSWSTSKKTKIDDTGWDTIDGKRYYYKDGVRLKGAHKIDGSKYYFSKDRDGELLGASYTMYKKIKDKKSDTKYAIAVSRELNRVCVYKREDGRWVLKKYWKCSTGAKSTPTPKGSFKTPKKKAKLNFFGMTEDYTCWYATRITGRVYFHSVLYNKYSRTSVQDGRLGMNLSHGCIRMAYDTAKWIHTNIKSGTRVVIY